MLCNFKSWILMIYDVDRGYLLFLSLHVAKNKENNLQFTTCRWKIDIKQIIWTRIPSTRKVTGNGRDRYKQMMKMHQEQLGYLNSLPPFFFFFFFAFACFVSRNWIGHAQTRITTSVVLLWEPHKQYKKANGEDTERWTPQVCRCPVCYWGSVKN